MDIQKKETTTPTLQELSQNIKDAREVSEQIGFTIILDCGSLLGAYRDGGPIKNDYDDVDFAVSYDVAEFNMLEIIQAFTRRGFELHRLRPTVMTFRRYGSKVDFLFYKETDDNYYLTLYHNKVPHALLTSKNAYNNLASIVFCGVEVACPADIVSHLESRYGDWKTPVLRPAFSFQNYIDHGVLIPLTQL